MMNGRAAAGTRAERDWSFALDGEEGDAAPAPEPTTFVTFELSEQLFAVDVAYVREILDRRPITPMPKAPHDVDGMIDVRGRSVAVVDLCARLGAMRREDTEETRIVVFEFPREDEEPLPLGVRADRVREVSQIPEEEIEPAPRTDSAWSAELVRGVARSEQGIVVILDIEKVFSSGGKGGGGDFDFG